MSSVEPVEIDGSTLEGGGQILRNAVSLASLCNRPISINKIRHGRNPPGLKNQHRVGLQLAEQITSGTLIGAKNGSTSIQYTPGLSIGTPGDFHADSVTAGAVTLLLQISLPLLLFSSSSATLPPSTLTLLGGTNASHAPQVDYMQHILLPFILGHFGLGADAIRIEVEKRGYFPRGGGKVVTTVQPLLQGQKLRPISLLERGKVVSIKGIAHYSKLPRNIGEGMVDGARRKLSKSAAGYGRASQIGTPEEVTVDIENSRESNKLAVAAGSGIVLWAELEGGGIIGGSAVGRKGIDPTAVGEEAASLLLKNLENGGCVDEYLQDQIIIFMALADGLSEVNCGSAELELHTRTAIWLAEQMTEAKFNVDRDAAGNIILRCQGIGYTATPPTTVNEEV